MWLLLSVLFCEEHVATWKSYTLCSTEADCSWFMKTFFGTIPHFRPGKELILALHRDYTV